MSIDDFVKEARISFLKSIKVEHSSSPDLVERAYIELKRWVFNNQLVSGQKLIYQDLADSLEMSKTPIIYALNRLENEGFVSRKVNRGYYISEMDNGEMSELFDAREAIEVFSVEMLIENFTNEKFEELERIIEYHSQTDYMDMQKRLILDIAFHSRMVEIANNKSLIKMLRGIFEHIYLAYRSEEIPLSRKVPAEKEHKKILEVIKNRDVKKAKSLIGRHIRSGKKAVLGSTEKPRSHSKWGVF